MDITTAGTTAGNLRRVWCLLDGSWALDRLIVFVVAGPVMNVHDAAAAQMEEGHGGLYALVWANPFCRSVG